MVSSPPFLSLSDDLHGPPFQQSSALVIEYMDSYKENKNAKTAQKYNLAPSLCSAQRWRKVICTN
jgi:hypothetical protein